MATKAIGYVRVSTSKQEVSPEAQRHALATYAQAQGYELVSVHEDLGVSGKAEIGDRPGFVELLGRVSEGSVVLVTSMDRLARDVVVATVLEQLVADRGGVLESADGVGNGNTPEATLMRTIRSAFAQYERALIVGRTKTALARLKADGRRVGSLPYGFRVGPGNKLLPEPAEQAVLERITKLYQSGFSASAIASRLNQDKVPARGKQWHRNTIRRQVQALGLKKSVES